MTSRSSARYLSKGNEVWDLVLMNVVEDLARGLGTTPKHLLKGIWT